MAAELKEILNSPGLLKLVAQNAFQTMDVDNSGFIDQEEFEDMIKDMSQSLNVPHPNKPILLGATTPQERVDEGLPGNRQGQRQKDLLRRIPSDGSRNHQAHG